MPLSRKPVPFGHPEWVFELNYDGFRSRAVVQNGRCQLISRNGHSFNSFTDLRQSIASELPQDGQLSWTEKLCVWTNGESRNSVISSSIAPSLISAPSIYS
jgi:ATP-dependent DNA ligase